MVQYMLTPECDGWNTKNKSGLLLFQAAENVPHYKSTMYSNHFNYPLTTGFITPSLTSGFMKDEGNMSICTKTEVVVHDIEG